jgi:quinol monooxygenase YgiN
MCSILRPKEVIAMSFIVTVKIPGDTNAFTKSLEERADEYREISGRGRTAGAIHHQFAVGDGFILVVDEWESAEAFQKFFSDPELKNFIGSVGGDPNAAPEITVGQAIDSPDRF